MKTKWNSFRSKKRPEEGELVVLLRYSKITGEPQIDEFNFSGKWGKIVGWTYWMSLEPLPKGENK